MRMRRTLVAVAVLLLSACALKDAPPPEETRGAALPNLKAPAQWTGAPAAPGAVGDDWLAAIDEPLLKALVAEALAFNTDLNVAWARVDTAGAYLVGARAPLWPQVNLVARGGGKLSGDSSGLQGVGLFAAWELDLWGRVRAAARATELQYEAAALDAEYARQSVAALVTKAWLAAVEARLQWAQTEAMLVSAEQLAALARERQRVGNGDEYDVALAQASVESLRDTARGLDLAYANAVRALEGQQQLLGLPGLEQVLPDAGLVHPGNDVLGLAVAGKDDADHVRPTVADLLQEFHPGHPRHALVAEDDADGCGRLPVFQDFHPGGGTGGGEDLEILVQRAPQRLLRTHFVVDDENGRESGRAGSVHSCVFQSRSRWRAR